VQLEYDPGSIIWLVGVCVVGPHRRDYHALWADNSDEEKRNLRLLADLVAANPSLPVVTWSGNSADIPQLRRATERLRLGVTLDAVQLRHLDLYQNVVKAVRFPFPELSLDSVASHFAIPRVSRIRDSFEAQFMYNEYRASSDNQKRADLKMKLLENNRDDLEALVGIAERLQELTQSCPKRG
jgi:predicted RecB family nuclease